MIARVKTLLLASVWVGLLASHAAYGANTSDHWFESLKDNATDRELHRFLYAMPKGGDLHNHLTGSIHPEWFHELALAAEQQGYTYYAKNQNQQLPVRHQ